MLTGLAGLSASLKGLLISVSVTTRLRAIAVLPALSCVGVMLRGVSRLLAPAVCLGLVRLPLRKVCLFPGSSRKPLWYM